MKLRTALDRAAKRIDDGKFENQPEVEADIRNTIARTYRSLGLVPEASKQAEQALDLCRRVRGELDSIALKALEKDRSRRCTASLFKYRLMSAAKSDGEPAPLT